MDVEVDMYSGRPNPRFRLPPEPAAELMRRLATLPPQSGAVALPEGLGYRGLRIEPSNDDDHFQEIRISEGSVLVRDRGGAERALADPGRSLERWLVQVGSGSLDPEVVSFVLQHSGPA